MPTRSRALGIFGAAALAASAVGCPPPSVTVTYYCNSRADCGPGEICRDGVCVADSSTPEGEADAAANSDAGDASYCTSERCPASPIPCQQTVCDDDGGCSYRQADDFTRCEQGVCIGGSCEARCWIDGELVPAGTADPDNVCLWCDPAREAYAYVEHPGAACDDGAWCTGTDSCSGGTCSDHQYTGDARCSGVRPACDEAHDRCVCTATSCPTGLVCSTATNRCQGVLSLALANDNQDGFQDPMSGNAVLLNYSWMSLYSTDHVGGLRFQIPALPTGAVITDAYLTVYVDSSEEGNAHLAIQVQNTANAPALLADVDNITSRTYLSSTVNWIAALPEGWATSPSLLSLVQAILAKPGWSAGNSILFKLVNTSGSFEFRQHDYSAGAYGSTLNIACEVP